MSGQLNSSDDLEQLLNSSKSTIVENSWCFSQRQVVELNYDWVIEHFSLNGKGTGEYVLSPVFYAQATPKIQWRAQLFPRGRSEETKDFVSLFLHNFSPETIQIPAKYKLSLLNPDRVLAKSSLRVQTFHNARGWGSPKLFRNEGLMDGSDRVLVSDKLKIRCQIIFELKQVNIVSCQSPLSSTAPLPVIAGSLSDQFAHLFEDMSSSDVTLTVRGQSFDAHKVVLSARSPVLAAMFHHDMRESQTGQLVISDIEPDVFYECLRFMYTDRTEKLTRFEMARDLLVAANKYMLDLLKLQCEDQLVKMLTVENACQLLVLADVHAVPRLKAAALQFIRSCLDAVVRTPGWSVMATRSDASLVIEVFQRPYTSTTDTVSPSESRTAGPGC